MSREECLDARGVEGEGVGQASGACVEGEGAGAAEEVVRVLFEDPGAELATDFGFADALDDVDAEGAQDADAFAVHARVGVAHADDDAGDAARGDGARAGGGATVEGAGLEGGVEGGADDVVAARGGVACGGDFGVIFARAEGVAEAEELAAWADDGAADPGVVAGGAPGALGLFDGDAHPALVLLGSVRDEVLGLGFGAHQCSLDHEE